MSKEKDFFFITGHRSHFISIYLASFSNRKQSSVMLYTDYIMHFDEGHFALQSYAIVLCECVTTAICTQTIMDIRVRKKICHYIVQTSLESKILAGTEKLLKCLP